MFDGNWEFDDNAMIGITAFILFLILVAFGLGTIRGSTEEQKLAIKAGVAHYVADEMGNSKFEYIKK